MTRAGIRRGANAPWTARAAFAVEAVLLVTLAYVVAGLVWAFVDPTAGLGAETNTRAARVAHTSAITYRPKSGGFNPFRAGSMSAASVEVAAEADAPLSLLNLEVLGARLSSVSLAGSAIIRTPDNAQHVYHVGDRLIDGVELYRIEEDRILLLRQGAVEALPFAERELAVIARGAPLGVDGEDRRAVTVISSAGALVQDDGAPGVSLAPAAQPVETTSVRTVGGSALLAGLSPRQAPEGEGGVVLYPRGDGAAFVAAGFEPGDIIKEVNGVVVADAVRFSDVISGLGRGSTVRVRFERGRETALLDFVLE